MRRHPLAFSEIRWVKNDPNELDITKMRFSADTLRVENMRGERLLLFSNEFNMRWVAERNPQLILSEFGNVNF